VLRSLWSGPLSLEMQTMVPRWAPALASHSSTVQLLVHHALMVTAVLQSVWQAAAIAWPHDVALSIQLVDLQLTSATPALPTCCHPPLSGVCPA
jgi:hypothetical protein